MVTIRQRSRLSQSIQIELNNYFCAGATARFAAELSRVNRNTSILIFHKLRETIFEEINNNESARMSGGI